MKRQTRSSLKAFLLKIDKSTMLYGSLARIRRICLRVNRLIFVQSRLSNLEKRREKISIGLAKKFEYTVQYGPFKGLRLSKKFNWGKSDIAPMLLGTYEQNLLEYIANRRIAIRNFINLGAGDGYYAAGMLFSGLARFAYAYEMNSSSRDLISKHMEINNLTDNFEIRGFAAPNFLDDFSEAQLVDSLILVDIEGGEFELFKQLDMTRLNACLIIIELHEFVPGSDSKISDLIFKLSGTHSLSVIKTGARNLDNFSELDGIPDNDRWLLISEGRPSNMKWVLCEPIQSMELL